jgi:putative ATP-binding cassette transporter
LRLFATLLHAGVFFTPCAIKSCTSRLSLIHVRENAEAIMLAHGEEAKPTTVGWVYRSCCEFSQNHSSLPECRILYDRLQLADSDHSRAHRGSFVYSGKIEFGVISQAAVAFSAIVAAFSLIVTQFQSLSNYAAVTARLSAMVELTEAVQPRR